MTPRGMMRPMLRWFVLMLLVCWSTRAGAAPPWTASPPGLAPTSQPIQGGPIYVVLKAYVDDATAPEAEAAALAWLLGRLDHHGIRRVTVSWTPEALARIDDVAPSTVDALVQRRATIALHTRSPQPPRSAKPEWQLYAYDRVRRQFDRGRTGGALRLLLRAGLAPSTGGDELGDLLRRRQRTSREDEDLHNLGIQLPPVAGLLAPPDRFVAAAVGEDAAAARPGVHAWFEAERIVARHAAGEGSILSGAEPGALDDLAVMASLAALTGIDLPKIPHVSAFVSGVPRTATSPRTSGAGEAAQKQLELALDEDPIGTRRRLGEACAALGAALHGRGSLATELAGRLDRLPDGGAYVTGVAWPVALEHSRIPWHAGGGPPRGAKERNAVRAQLDATLAALAKNPRVRFVAPGQATQWLPDNRGEALSWRAFELPTSQLQGTLTPVTVDTLHRKARLEDLRRR